MPKKTICEESHQVVEPLRRRVSLTENLHQFLKDGGLEPDSILDEINDGVYVLDNKGRFVFVNRSIEKRSGIPFDKFIGLYFLDLGNPKGLKRLRANFDQVMKGEEVSPFEFEYTTASGKTVVVEVGKRAIYRNGKIVGVLGITREITQRKRAEESLRKSEKSFRAISQAIPVPVMISRRTDSVILWANEHFAQLVGLDLGKLIGRKTVEFFCDPADRQVIRDMLRQKGYVDRYEFQAMRTDGERFWLITSSQPLLFEGEKAYLSGFYAITERKVAEDAMKKAHDTLEQRVQERTFQLEEANERLEKLNTGLQVLMEHRQEEMRRLQENIMENANKLITPYLDKMDKRKMGAQNRAYLEVIASGLKELVSPFANTFSSKQVGLSPAEIRIADLVKQGKTSKEIASLLNVSTNAITVHRYHIRKKLGLLNKKINLRSYLQSLSE